MAVNSNYRLPGVYSNDATGPFVNVTGGGNAMVALVGPALGYSTASQQATFSGENPIELEETGVISGGVKIRSRATGTSYTSGEDFTEYTNLDGVTTVTRRLQTTSLEVKQISSRRKTFYTAEPEFSVLVDQYGADVVGYPICGSVVIIDTTPDEDVTLEEDTDYVIDYLTGMLSAVDGGRLADPESNAHVLDISLDYCTAEPIKLVGESAWSFEHNYISENGLPEGSIKLVSCAYTSGEDTYEWGDTPGAEEGYIEGVDFIIDYQTGRIMRTATSRIPSYDPGAKNYLYAEFAYDLIRDGEQVVIEYMYQGDGFGSAVMVSSYLEAASVYGSAWDTETGDVVSPLSLAAYLAFQNGMSQCYMVAVKGTVTNVTEYDEATGQTTTKTRIDYTAGDWEEAFDTLTTVTGIDIVVPITDDTSYLQLCQAHLATMKLNQDERVMICGLDGTEKVKTVTELIAKANSFGDRDVWMVGPSTMRFRNPVRNTIDIIPGYYVAAAVAGYNSSVPQYTPLTRKALTGFYSANEYITKLNKTNACANGVMYVDEINGQLRVLHGTSTDVQSTVTRETNVTLAKYFIIKMLRNMFEVGYIGEIVTDETLLSIQSVMFSALTRLSENNYIYSFSDLAVSIDQQLPTQVNITFQYVPVYGMNYIQISFAIDTSTNSIDTQLY